MQKCTLNTDIYKSWYYSLTPVNLTSVYIERLVKTEEKSDLPSINYCPHRMWCIWCKIFIKAGRQLFKNILWKKVQQTFWRIKRNWTDSALHTLWKHVVTFNCNLFSRSTKRNFSKEQNILNKHCLGNHITKPDIKSY